jgi:choline kinase
MSGQNLDRGVASLATQPLGGMRATPKRNIEERGERRELKAIILSAGQGRRLLPLTENLPKCLLPICGRTVLDWQLRALAAAGLERATVVVGFAADKVQSELESNPPPAMHVQTIYNTLYDRADNLMSCWSARSHMEDDFLLLNGDTLFEPGIITRLLASDASPVALAVARKTGYDADDMKVSCRAGTILRVGKDIPAAQIDGEAIGVSFFRGDGPRLFREALEQTARQPDAARRWYLSAVNTLAERGLVRAVGIDGMGWSEIDYQRDLVPAQALVAGWLDRGGSERITPSAVANAE